MKRNVPITFLNIIINRYNKLTVMIRWNTALSGILRVCSGICQGRVLSPSLFNVYADMFINNVLINNNGCHIN